MLSLFLCFISSSRHLSGYKTKSPAYLSPEISTCRTCRHCKVTRSVCSVLDPPRFETSPVYIVESKLTMGTGIRDPPVIGKRFISQQECRSTRPDCKKILMYVGVNSKHICFEQNSGITGINLMYDIFVSLVRFLHTQIFSIRLLDIRGLKHKAFKLLKLICYVMNHQFNIRQLYALPTLYLCVLYLSENKQRLVPLTA